MNKYFIMLLILMLGCGFMGYGLRMYQEWKTETDTAVYVDTIPYNEPVPKDSAVIRYVKKYLPVARREDAEDSSLNIGYIYKDVDFIPADSVAVEVPITQKTYEGEDYKAWVSGYEPNLDSIKVVLKTTVIREKVPPSKWSIGVTGGYGYGLKSKLLEPFVGVGVSYRIW